MTTGSAVLKIFMSYLLHEVTWAEEFQVKNCLSRYPNFFVYISFLVKVQWQSFYAFKVKRIKKHSKYSQLWSCSKWMVQKRYDVKECATHGIFWVNLKFEDHYLIDASLYTYLCITICIAICISADGCTLWQRKLGSTAALDFGTGQRQILKKSSYSYSSCLMVPKI